MDARSPALSAFGERGAALSMYDPPELNAANDALWSGIHRRLVDAGVRDVPLRLTRAPRPDEGWSNPRLLLSQTCGYPLITHLAGRVQIVATPAYNVEGCDGPFYRSALMVRTDATTADLADLRGSRCAVNDLASNSGANLLRDAVAPLAGRRPFFSGTIVTAPMPPAPRPSRTATRTSPRSTA